MKEQKKRKKYLLIYFHIFYENRETLQKCLHNFAEFLLSFFGSVKKLAQVKLQEAFEVSKRLCRC